MKNASLDRRSFLKGAAAVTIAAGIPEIVSSAFAAEKVSKIKLNAGETLLFQGDSITDFGRDRNPPNFNIGNADRQSKYNDVNSLGPGYPMLAASEILFHIPDKKLKIMNRAISGNKVFQLADRWDEDCLNLKPNVVSILVGVNDYWHTLDFGYKGTADIYRSDYRKLLDRTLTALPGVRFIIGEPYGMRGVGAVTDKWYPEFDKYRQIARDIASEYKAFFIPYQSVFDKAAEIAPASYWTFDGVHPSIPGCKLIANAWLKSVNF